MSELVWEELELVPGGIIYRRRPVHDCKPPPGVDSYEVGDVWRCICREPVYFEVVAHGPLTWLPARPALVAQIRAMLAAQGER